MKTKQLNRPFELKKASNDGEFSGYGSVFGVEDSYKDVVLPGAFKDSLSAWGQKNKLPKMLWQHRSDSPIGVYTKMYEDDHGLFMEGKLITEVTQGKEALALMKAGALDSFSIGYSLKEWTTVKQDDGGVIYQLSKLDLWEVSLVTFPANDQALLAEVKAVLESGNLPTEREFELLLRDAGFSATNAKAIIATGFKSLRATRDAGDDGDYQKAADAFDRALNAIKN